MTNILPVLDHASAGIPASLERLFDLVRIKSISTDPAFKAECRRAAEWLVTELRLLGFDATVRETPGHPMVVAHHDGAKPDAPHVLFYGHYDVQPVDLDERVAQGGFPRVVGHDDQRHRRAGR